MTSVTRLRPPRVVLALVGVALVLVLVLVLAEPPAAQGQNRGGSRVPSQLWKTYPLDPSHGKARIRTDEQNGTGEETAPEQGSEQPAGTTEQPAGTTQQPAGTSPAPGRDVRGEDEPSSGLGLESRTLQMVAVLVVSLLALLVVLFVARPVARRVATVPSALARRGSASPVRPGTGAPGPKFRAGSLGSSTTTVRPAATPAVEGARVVAARRPGVVTRSWRRMRELALRTASYATAPFRALRRVGTALATGVEQAADVVSSRRYQILLYSVAVLAAASLGFVVSLFLNGA